MSTSQNNPTTGADSIAREFFLWALATLRLPVRRSDGGVYEVVVPEDSAAAFGGSETVRFTFDGTPGAERTAPERISLSSPLFDWAVGRLRRMGEVVHAAPAGQPDSVRQLTSRLFDAYTVDGGGVRLAGCTLEDEPLLRHTYRIRSASSHVDDRLAHIYTSIEGRPVDESLLAALRADDLVPFDGKPPRATGEELRGWAAAGEQRAPVVAQDEQAERLVTAAVWCKYFHCKLLFEIGEARADLSFDGWAQLLVDGEIEPPPFQCAHTGRSSYRVVAIDDGRITVPDAIARCEESGRQVLESDLATCAATGRRALPKFLRTCAVTGDRVVPSAMATCSMCRQCVSPSCLVGGRCQACRSLQTIRADDPRMARVLGEFPKLDRWSRWRIAETHASYILTATSILRRLLVVLDKDPLDAMHLATGSRFGRRWVDVPQQQWKEYLG